MLTLPTNNSSDSSVPLPIRPTNNGADSSARLITAENNTPNSQNSQSSSGATDEEPVRDLPSFHPVAKPTFTWGKCTSGVFIQSLDEAYSEVVHWRPNFFSLPFGNAGKAFVLELTRLYKAFATNSALECVAMKAAIVLPILALQKPSSSFEEKSACSLPGEKVVLVVGWKHLGAYQGRQGNTTSLTQI